jgi:hypothetical protein
LSPTRHSNRAGWPASGIRLKAGHPPAEGDPPVNAAAYFPCP